MRIHHILNATEQEIKEKRFNIFIGISLGNKYFSKENIKEYIAYALENTKDKIVILIADRIYAINLEIRNGYSENRALKVAIKSGDEIEKQILEIIEELGESQRKKIKIVRWGDIELNEQYPKDKRDILKFFETNPQFKKEVIEVVKEVITLSKPNDLDYERLSLYPLLELPLFIRGFEYEGIFYNLIPYPGLGKIDYLASDIANNKKFPELNKILNPNKEKCVLVEAYPK